MTRLDHRQNDQRVRRRELQGQARYEQAKSHGVSIRDEEQARFRRIAKRYADVVPFCREIVEGGHPISQPQAAALGQIEAEQDAKVRGRRPRVRTTRTRCAALTVGGQPCRRRPTDGGKCDDHAEGR